MSEGEGMGWPPDPLSQVSEILKLELASVGTKLSHTHMLAWIRTFTRMHARTQGSTLQYTHYRLNFSNAYYTHTHTPSPGKCFD